MASPINPASGTIANAEARNTRIGLARDQLNPIATGMRIKRYFKFNRPIYPTFDPDPASDRAISPKMCGTSAKLIARVSPLMVHTCRACAECCETCFTECEKFDAPKMKAVVESLRTCAKACRDMVKAMSGTH